MTLVNAMNWLAPEPAVDTLPLLPQVHDGRHQVLEMIAPENPATATITVLRLWPSELRLADTDQSVWIGKVGVLYQENRLPLISYLRSADDYLQTLGILTASLQHSPDIETRTVQRTDITLDGEWQGQVLLAWE